MENSLIKYQGTVVKRVGIAIDITNKLIKGRHKQSVQLYNPSTYQRSIAEKEELFTFIKINFWHFLKEIIQKEKSKDYIYCDISEVTLNKIKRNKYRYEYPHCCSNWCYYKPKNQSELSEERHEGFYLQMEEEFKKEILNCICPTITGKILSLFIDTSIGLALGVAVKKC